MKLKMTNVAERYPENGTLCVISDGTNFQTAHYFEQSYNPRSGETTENVFVNRVSIGFGWVETVTTWIDIRNLVSLLKK